MSKIEAHNLTEVDQLFHPVSQYFKGTAYTSFDRTTFSYNRRTEGEIIEKQKPKPARRSVYRKKVKRSNSRKRVRWSEVRKRCQAFFLLPQSQKYTVFVTISFPAGLSDEEARSALNKWLGRIRLIRKRFPYLWVAERQKNKTLHFHLLTNMYLPVRVVNGFMATILNNLRNKHPKVFKNFSKSEYNGVDLKAIRNQKALKGYITKYITKNETNITGSPWHCSRLFSNLATTICMHPLSMYHFIRGLMLARDRSFKSLRVIVTEFSVTILLPHQIPKTWQKKLIIYNTKLAEAFQ